MKLDDSTRHTLFLFARQLSADLGGPFQNRMTLTDEMMVQERASIQQFKNQVQMYENMLDHVHAQIVAEDL